MAGGKGRRPGAGAPTRTSEERRRDLLWLLPFGGLIAGALVVALAAGGGDVPPMPTYSPETPSPTAGPTEPEDQGPTEQPTVSEVPAVFGTVRAMAPVPGGILLGAEDGPWLLLEDGGQRRLEGSGHRLSALAALADGGLLGSGLREGGASPLGLARSPDGQEWTSVALDGQALFGKLRVLGPRVYGWDAGTSALVVSDDLREWESRSVEPRLLDFVVDPADPEHLLRAVPEGGVGLPEVQESLDGGRTWKRVAAPSLFLLSWHGPERLWALTEDGTVFRSRDGGHSWSPRNNLSVPPTAILDTGEALYVALTRVGVYRSTDDARTWQRVDEP